MISPSTNPEHKVEIQVVQQDLTLRIGSPEQEADTAEIHLCPRSCRNDTEDRLCGSNYGFLIRVLHLLEGLLEFFLPQCLRIILVLFFLRVYSRSLNLTKSIHKAVEAKYHTEHRENHVIFRITFKTTNDVSQTLNNLSGGAFFQNFIFVLN